MPFPFSLYIYVVRICGSILFCSFPLVISSCLIWQFSKESGKYIDEKKLRVVLISPPHSPVLLPNNGELKKDSSYDAPLHKNIAQNGIENIPPPQRVRSLYTVVKIISTKLQYLLFLSPSPSSFIFVACLLICFCLVLGAFSWGSIHAIA